MIDFWSQMTYGLVIVSSWFGKIVSNFNCKRQYVAPSQKDNHINMQLTPTFNPSNMAWFFATIFYN
jgi:hypothetical protein